MKHLRHALMFAIGVLPAAAFYLWFQYSRYGGWQDESIWRHFATDPGGGQAKHIGHGPFSLAYLPNNLCTYLLLGWGFNSKFPYLHPSAAGQSILLTSPALICTLRASLRWPEVWLLWLMIGATLIPSLTVYSAGYAQFGLRYWVQVLPMFLVLLSWQPVDQMFKILTVASIGLVQFGIWHISTRGFG